MAIFGVPFPSLGDCASTSIAAPGIRAAAPATCIAVLRENFMVCTRVYTNRVNLKPGMRAPVRILLALAIAAASVCPAYCEAQASQHSCCHEKQQKPCTHHAAAVVQVAPQVAVTPVLPVLTAPVALCSEPALLFARTAAPPQPRTHTLVLRM